MNTKSYNDWTLHTSCTQTLRLAAYFQFCSNCHMQLLANLESCVWYWSCETACMLRSRCFPAWCCYQVTKLVHFYIRLLLTVVKSVAAIRVVWFILSKWNLSVIFTMILYYFKMSAKWLQWLYFAEQ